MGETTWRLVRIFALDADGHGEGERQIVARGMTHQDARQIEKAMDQRERLADWRYEIEPEDEASK